MMGIKCIVIGGSAGSLQVILAIFRELPAGFPIPVLLILHRNNQLGSALDEVLAARAPLRIKEVEEKEFLQPATVYLAPMDYHVLIEKDHSFSLDYSEPVHFSRPSIDVSLRSAADVYGNQLAGILLSGANADGAEGLLYVREKGGIAIVQDPEEAESPMMPRLALRQTTVDRILPSGELGKYIAGLGKDTGRPETGESRMPGPGR